MKLRGLHAWTLAAMALGSLVSSCGAAAFAAHQRAQTLTTVVYDRTPDGTALPADIYTRGPSARAEPVVVLIHGGGFDAGDKSGTASYARELSRDGYVVMNVNYTLTTAQRPGFDLQIREIRAALEWAATSIQRYGGDPQHVGVVGFSAGGYLAAMAALENNRVTTTPRVRSVVTLSAPFDLMSFQQLFRSRLLDCGLRPQCAAIPVPPLAAFAVIGRFLGCSLDRCDHALLQSASPVNQVTATAPRFVMFNSAHEIVPVTQATRMLQQLREVGCPSSLSIVKGQRHGADYLPVVASRIQEGLVSALGRPRVGSHGDGGHLAGRGAWIASAIGLIAANAIGLGARTARRERG
jgi:acetyl esterase/lipase